MKIQFRTTLILTVLSAATLWAAPQKAALKEPKVTLLPNGWKISPVGQHFTVGDLPMNMVVSPDGDHVIVTNNGYSQPNLVVYDHTKQITRERVALESAWLGLAFHPDGERLFSSGSAKNRVDEFSWDRGALKKTGDFVLPKPANDSFVGGLAVSPDGQRLYAVHVLGEKLHAIDLETRAVVKTIDLKAEPYTVLVSPDSATVYLSLWGGARVLVFNAADDGCDIDQQQKRGANHYQAAEQYRNRRDAHEFVDHHIA
jgi:sugar lactone lactonase YvrE